MDFFDADVHLSPFREDAAADKILNNMDAAGIRRALVWLLPTGPEGVSEGNRYVYDEAQRRKERFEPFGWVTPVAGKASALREISVCHEDYGFRGIKFNGSAGQFEIDSPLNMELIEEVVKRGLIAAFHIGADAPDRTNPYRFKRIAERFPDSPIICVHFGGVYRHPTLNMGPVTLEILKQHENVLLVGSEQSDQMLLRATEVVGAKRLAFASDMPFCFGDVEVARYNALFKDKISETDFSAIASQNLERFLELA